jgi:predicted CXXCH cytochrome family protein
LAASFAAGAKHPSLVDPEKTRCGTCHTELVENAVVHPPVADDCLSCHDFTKGDEGLSVALMAEGSELCIMCHDTMEAAAMGEIEAPHAPVMDDCTNCHDAHSTEQQHLLTTDPEELCLSCHDLGETNDLHGIPVSRGDCRTCHSAHGSASEHMLLGNELHQPFAEGVCEGCHKKPRGTRIRLIAEGSELCYACHGDLEEEFSQGSMHGALERDGCTGCHNPHMAAQAKFLKLPGSDLCFSCHPDVQSRATGSGAHAAVEDGCDSCHDPHHGEYEYQLVEETPPLCLMCHDAEDPDLTAKHLGADMTTIACTACHDPHGSSEAHLVADGSIHPPFVEDCESCHEGSAAEIMEDGSQDLCFACHSDVEEQVTNASVQHAAIEAGECVDCHSPHSSKNRKLLRSRGPAVCTTCHDDMAPGPEQVAHGVIDWFGCQSCHLPHGGDNESLLRQTGNDLCNDCHLRGEVEVNDDGVAAFPGGFTIDGSRLEEMEVVRLTSGRRLDHPITAHPVAGTVTGQTTADIPEDMIGTELSCLSCHQPHVGRSRQLFRYGAVSGAQLCMQCHPK